MLLFVICCFQNATAYNISFFEKCPFDPTVKGMSFVKKVVYVLMMLEMDINCSNASPV